VSTVSAAPAFKVALFTIGSNLPMWSDPANPVLVTYGMPAFDYFNDVISFGSTVVHQEPAAIGSLRPREETLTQEVTFYCFQGGGQEAELTTMQRAYELLEPLELYCRTTDTSLGDVVRYCYLTDIASDQSTDEDVLSKGRMHVLTATFTATNRVSS
jgi:hypothetical protein